MATIDQQFVEYIVKTLVGNPEKVAVDRAIDEKGVLLTLTVDPSDVGRVIGKRGVTAQAIRVLLRALGTKQDARFNLKIVNTDEDGESAPKKETDHTRDEKPTTKEDDDAEDEADEEVEDEANEEAESEEDEEEPDEETSELAEKTRAELADLDDLDI